MENQVGKTLSQLLKNTESDENIFTGEQLGGKRAAMQYYHDRFEAV